MAINLGDIREGMDVFGSDGKKVGKAAGVVTSMLDSSVRTTPEAGLDGAGVGATPNTYLKVDRHGLFDRGGPLYVPSTQIASVQGGEKVELFCSREACMQEFAGEPPDLQ